MIVKNHRSASIMTIFVYILSLVLCAMQLWLNDATELTDKASDQKFRCSQIALKQWTGNILQNIFLGNAKYSYAYVYILISRWLS